MNRLLTRRPFNKHGTASPMATKAMKKMAWFRCSITLERVTDGNLNRHSWTVPLAVNFKLHAHPNLELVYCIRGGELHEVRLNDVPAKNFETTGASFTKNKDPQVIGPSLAHCKAPWRFGTLSQGQWLVNRVDTMHKSFTATKGNGYSLLVLWGGRFRTL